MLLILVVGLLAGVAVAGVCVQLDGMSVIGSLQMDRLIAPPHTQIPTQIVIGGGSDPVPTGGSVLADPAGAQAPATSPLPGQPTATTAVVPANVYAYPPGDSGHGGSSDGRGGHGR